MPRAKAILQSEFPYHITSRCINREWFNIPMPVVWDIFSEELMNTHRQYNLIIHSFVLMGNHYHTLGSTPDSNISDCMRYFNSRTSDKLNREGNRINQTFAGRHFKCVLQHQSHFYNAYKYIYRNPVTAKICEKVEDYPFSSLRGVLGLETLKFPVADTIFSNNSVELLTWLNTQPSKDKLEALRIGLQRQVFKSAKSRNDGKLILPDGLII